MLIRLRVAQATLSTHNLLLMSFAANETTNEFVQNQLLNATIMNSDINKMGDLFVYLIFLILIQKTHRYIQIHYDKVPRHPPPRDTEIAFQTGGILEYRILLKRILEIRLPRKTLDLINLYDTAVYSLLANI